MFRMDDGEMRNCAHAHPRRCADGQSAGAYAAIARSPRLQLARRGRSEAGAVWHVQPESLRRHEDPSQGV